MRVISKWQSKILLLIIRGEISNYRCVVQFAKIFAKQDLAIKIHSLFVKILLPGSSKLIAKILQKLDLPARHEGCFFPTIILPMYICTYQRLSGDR